MKLKNLNKTLLAASIALAAPLFAGVSVAAEVPAGVTLAENQDLVRGIGTEVPTLDPTKTSDTSSSAAISDMFDGLVTEDLKGDVIPALAESWTVSDDGLVYTFKMRDAQWSNGSPITAQDFVYSMRRLVDPNTGSSYSWYLETAGVKGAAAVTKGGAKPETLAVKAIDDKTLEVTLESPRPYFLKTLTHPSTFAVPKAVIDKFGDAWTKPENIVVSGAYTLSDWVVNEKLEMVRNEKYWNNAKTVINKVTYLPIDDQNAEYNRFRTGEIDITWTFPLEQYKQIKKDYPDELLTMPSLGTYYYLFNLQQKPFDDVRVRKALSYAIDRDIIVQRILGQGQLPAYSNTPPAVAGFDVPELAWSKLTQAERNEQATKLLEEAGFNADNPLEFELIYNTSESHKKIAVAVSSMWKKALGSHIKVKIANQEWKTFLQTLGNKNFSVARYAWVGDYNEASTFLSYFASNGLNYGGWSSPEYDKALTDAAIEKDETKRMQYYQQAEQIFADNMPAAPVYFYTRSVLKSQKVGGYPVDNASDNRYTRDLYLVK